MPLSKKVIRKMSEMVEEYGLCYTLDAFSAVLAEHASDVKSEDANYAYDDALGYLEDAADSCREAAEFEDKDEDEEDDE